MIPYSTNTLNHPIHMTEVNHPADTANKTLHRREEIVRLVSEQGKASVEELSARYTVSSVTIRNDLNHLNKKGLLIRSRGGAIACKINTIELPLQEKHTKNLNIKQKISQVAASLINNGDTVILDSGTTTQEIARRLDRHKDLIVMTNGLNVANELSRHEAIDMMMTGGHYRQKSMSFYGAQAEESLKQLRFDKVFLGVDGYDIEAGITTHFDPEARLNRLMCQGSREVIIVTDSSKFEQRGFQVILPFDQVDTLITDKGIPKRYLDELKRKGVNVLIVDE